MKPATHNDGQANLRAIIHKTLPIGKANKKFAKEIKKEIHRRRVEAGNG
jgi:hypothetical protein